VKWGKGISQWLVIIPIDGTWEQKSQTGFPVVKRSRANHLYWEGGGEAEYCKTIEKGLLKGMIIPSASLKKGYGKKEKIKEEPIREKFGRR